SIADVGNFDVLTTVSDALALQPDDKIVIAGGTDGDVALARFNGDGSLDTSFDEDGKVVADFGFSESRDLAIQSERLSSPEVDIRVLPSHDTMLGK
ncbi:MAG: delta-60 repeat domain-containing protein, partial [Geitlerinemataceae cyanobacterium]